MTRIDGLARVRISSAPAIVRKLFFASFICAAAIGSACHSAAVRTLSGDPAPRSAWVVGGTASDICTGGPARGRVLHLIDSDGKILAEDVSGVDGSFVLRPEAEEKYRDGLYIESEGRKALLVDDAHAEYLQTHVFKAVMYFDCKFPPPQVQNAVLKVPVDAGTPEQVEPVRAPSKKAPSNLIPHGYLGG